MRIRKQTCTTFAVTVALVHFVLSCAARSDVTFKDVTASAGVDYLQYQLPVSPPSLEQYYMSGGAAAGDVDGDGWTDLFVTRLGASDILFRNRGDGTFENASAAAGFTANLRSNGAAFGDIDNDGDLDLYVSTIDHDRFYLYVNDGLGRFREEAVARGAALDDGQAHFGYSMSLGDYDRDGWLDVHTTEWGQLESGVDSVARLLHNRGPTAPGHFTDVTDAAGVRLESQPNPDGRRTVAAFASRFSDLDGDGWPDLAVASDFGTSQLFWNNGDGTFANGTVAAGVGTDENGMGSAIGDYDGDGRMDWFVTSIFDPAETCDHGDGCGWGYSGNRMYRNLGGRTFEDATDAAGVRNVDWGWGTAFFDYDNDGDLDLIATNGVDFPAIDTEEAFNRDRTRLWRNDEGVFAEVSAISGIDDNGSGKGLLTFDYDNDGKLDVFVVNNAGHPVLYRNDGESDASFLRVQTVGVDSNRQGIGALITVEAEIGGPTQIREVDAGSHFLGQSETIAHFGLGPDVERVARLSILWPSGRVQEFFDVDANALFTAVEPTEPVPEPTGLLLLASGAGLLALKVRRRTRRLALRGVGLRRVDVNALE